MCTPETEHSCQLWWQALLPAEPSCLPIVTIQCRRFSHYFVLRQKTTGDQVFCSHLQARPFPEENSPRSAEIPLPTESAPEPESTFDSSLASVSQCALLPTQHHTALTRQCALNSCSWLFRLSFMATSALRFCRMLGRDQKTARGRPLRCDYESLLKPQ